MSTRRKAGDLVWLKPYSGFVGESWKYQVEIQPEENRHGTIMDPEPCMLNCGDPECKEWANTVTVLPIDGKRQLLCHVSECQMLDAPVGADGKSLPIAEIGEVEVLIAQPIRDDSWLNEPRFAWFKKGYERASVMNQAIPALAKCTPEELYHAVRVIAGKDKE